MGDGSAGSGSAAEAQIDAAGKQAGQHSEGFRHLKRAVMRQHDATGPHTDGRSRFRYRTDQDLGAGAGESGSSMVFGQPIARVAETVGQPREVDGIAERVT